ncbi:MAG: hypothetical protein A3208_04830 [Candidatus Methanoprimaticola hominis]|nr:MAG: hypothetical protein A3208_04830 [Methanomassiliicoccales archaeon Mx-06]
MRTDTDSIESISRSRRSCPNDLRNILVSHLTPQSFSQMETIRRTLFEDRYPVSLWIIGANMAEDPVTLSERRRR